MKPPLNSSSSYSGKKSACEELARYSVSRSSAASSKAFATLLRAVTSTSGPTRSLGPVAGVNGTAATSLG